MEKYVVDTHALVWYLTKDSKLSEKALSILSDPASQLFFMVIVFAEIDYLNRKDKIKIDSVDLIDKLKKDRNCTLIDFTFDLLPFCLPELDIHDAMICSYALKNDYFVLTKDGKIHQSGKVKVIW